MVLSEMDAGQSFKYSGDKVVAVLLPLQKNPDQSISRLFRSPAGQITTSPIHIASNTYKDIFILGQPDKYEGL
jgi:hypothetical protein